MKPLLPLKNLTTPLVIASLITGSTLSMTQAQAGQVHKYDKWGNQTHIYQNSRKAAPRRHYRKRNRSGDLIAAGIIGLTLGAILTDANRKIKLNQQENKYSNKSYLNNSYRRPYNSENNSYIFQQESNNYNNEDVITYEDTASLEPWTLGWTQYCSQRYRSFNPQSGTYKGYDGLHHFCVAE